MPGRRQVRPARSSNVPRNTRGGARFMRRQSSTDYPLPTAAPFHLEATARVLQRRPANRVDRWEQDSYVRVLQTTDALTLVRVRNAGSIDAPQLGYAVLTGANSAAAHASIQRQLRRILGLDIDPGALQSLAIIEPTLAPHVHALRGLRPPRFANLFEAFASVIPFQQLSLEAGIAVLGRIIEAFGVRLMHGSSTYFAFPDASTIAAASDSALRDCGLSLKKAQTLRRLAHEIHSGRLEETRLEAMPSHQALNELTQQPGVGPWTAGLVLLRGLGRTDVFPDGDTGAARGLRALFSLDRQAQIAPLVARFGNRRGWLYFFNLGTNLLSRGVITGNDSRTRT